MLLALWLGKAEEALGNKTVAEKLYNDAVDLADPQNPDAILAYSALAAFLPYVDAVPLDEDAAVHYAEIRADLKRRGAMIGANDLLIAAHARALDLTLVTNTIAEFERVDGLKLENWTIPPRRKK